MISKGSLVRIPAYSLDEHADSDESAEWSEEVFLVVSDTWENDWGQTLVNVWVGPGAPRARWVVDNLKVVSQ